MHPHNPPFHLSPFPSPSALLLPQPPITPRPSPLSGLGQYATRAIPAYTHILTDAPLLSLQSSQDLPDLYTSFLALPPEKQHQYLALHHDPHPDRDAALRTKLLLRAVPPSDIDRMIHVAVVFERNAFNLPTSSRRAVFPRVARMNHSCGPNAQAVDVDGYMEVFALREIPLGAEVQIAYFNVLMTKAARRQRGASWGFQCGCQVCAGVDGGGGGGVGEERRERVRNWLLMQREVLGSSAVDVETRRRVVAEGEALAEMLEGDRTGLNVALADVCDGVGMLVAVGMAEEGGRDGREERKEVLQWLERAAVADARVTGARSAATKRRLGKCEEFGAVKGKRKGVRLVGRGGMETRVVWEES